MHGQSGAELPTPPGVVELREDVPLAGLAGRGGRARCAGGPRLIGGCFTALSVSITLALVSQLYYGEYEVVPHGSVSSSAAECSRAGTDALKAGGRALDAAAAAALCLAVVAPHRTSLDASGSLLYWEYRKGRTQPVELVEWGGGGGGGGAGGEGGAVRRAPRLVAALVALHAQLGALSWASVLQPAVQLARTGYNVSEGLADALAARGRDESRPAGTLRAAPLLAEYLAALQRNTSIELAAAWGATALLRRRSVAGAAAGRWRVWAGGAGAEAVTHALTVALQLPSPGDAEVVRARAVTALQAESSAQSSWSPASVASGLAVVDRLDTYAALVTGVSQSFGSGPESGDGWTSDEPGAPLDLAPAILTEERVCGTRFIVGAESTAALVQAASALAAEGAPAAVERERVPVWPERFGEGNASLSAVSAAVNVVRQRGDTLASHADSRGGGHASRF